MKLIGTKIKKKDIILGLISLLLGSLLTLFINYPTINSLNCKSKNVEVSSIEEINAVGKDKCIKISGTIDKSNLFREQNSNVVLSPLKEYSNKILIMFDYEQIDRLNGSFIGKIEMLSDGTLNKLNTKPEIEISTNLSSNEQITINPELIGNIIDESSIEFDLNTKVVNTFEVESLNRLNIFLFFVENVLLSLAVFEIAKALDRQERFKVRRRRVLIED